MLGIQFYDRRGRPVWLRDNKTYRWRVNRYDEVFINEEPIHAPNCARMALESFRDLELKLGQAGVTITVEGYSGEATPKQLLGGGSVSGTVTFRVDGESETRTLEVKGGQWYVDGQPV